MRVCDALAFPHPVVKNTWREHRLVILPDFQGRRTLFVQLAR